MTGTPWEVPVPRKVIFKILGSFVEVQLENPGWIFL
jgi:hypothetical protein